MKVRRLDYYPDEYIVGVSRMTFEHQGVYWMICSLIMSRGGPIENDPKWIGNLGGMGSAKCRNIIKDLIAIGKLSENSGKIGQKRAENELKTAQKRIETARENGGKGGRPPNNPNDLQEPDGFSDEKLTTNYQLSTSNESPNGDSPLPPNRSARYPTAKNLRRLDNGRVAYPDAFEAAWQAYPVRSEDTRQACYAHWRKAVVENRVDPGVIVKGAEVWALVQAENDHRFGLLRWLREALWNNPPPPVQRQRDGPSSVVTALRNLNSRDRDGSHEPQQESDRALPCLPEPPEAFGEGDEDESGRFGDDAGELCQEPGNFRAASGFRRM